MKKHGIEVPVFRVKKGTPVENDIVKQLKVVTAPHWAVYENDGKSLKLIDSAGGFEWSRVNKALGI